MTSHSAPASGSSPSLLDRFHNHIRSWVAASGFRFKSQANASLGAAPLVLAKRNEDEDDPDEDETLDDEDEDGEDPPARKKKKKGLPPSPASPAKDPEERSPSGVLERAAARVKAMQDAGMPRVVLPPAPAAAQKMPLPVPQPAGSAPAAAIAPPVPAARSRAEEIAVTAGIVAASKSSSEIWRGLEHLKKLENGEDVGAFLRQEDHEKLEKGLHAQLANAASNEEKWRLCEQIGRLERGEPLGSTHCQITEQVAVLEARMATAKDSHEIWALNDQIESVKSGKPYVSREEKQARISDLEAKLAVETCPREIFRLADAINNGVPYVSAAESRAKYEALEEKLAATSCPRGQALIAAEMNELFWNC